MTCQIKQTFTFPKSEAMQLSASPVFQEQQSVPPLSLVFQKVPVVPCLTSVHSANRQFN